MTSGGFSTTGLTRLHDVMAAHVERCAMPGLIALVARPGETPRRGDRYQGLRRHRVAEAKRRDFWRCAYEAIAD
jgi:hypothetical protein